MKKDAINIKGTINGLVICIDQQADLSHLVAELEAKIQAKPDFFKNAKFKVHAKQAMAPELIKELENICSSYGMITSSEIKWPYRDDAPSTPQVNHPNYPVEVPKSFKASELAASSETYHNNTPSTVSLQETLLIQKNLRSGQRLHYQGNLVILGDVNPGAEVSAGGDIIVMGSLRGIAHAGAYGNEKAIILAYRLEPTQLRISDKITRSPEKNYVASQPELARLSEGQMFIEPYRSQKTNWEMMI